MEQLRIGNCPSISDVEYAIMESNGDLSIIPKANKKPLTAEDMSIEKNRESMPVVLITDGILYKGNIITAGWTETQLKEALVSNGISNYKDEFLAFCDEQSKLHIFMPNEKESLAKDITS